MIKNKKYVMLGYGYYLIGAVYLNLLCIGFLLLCTILYINGRYMPGQEWICITMIVMGSLFIVVTFIVSGQKLIQLVIIDKNGITARSLFKTIKFVQWCNVKEIYIEKMPVSVSYGFKTGWITINDREVGIEDNSRNGINSAEGFIRIKLRKRTLRILNEFWDKELEEKLLTDS